MTPVSITKVRPRSSEKSCGVMSESRGRFKREIVRDLRQNNFSGNLRVETSLQWVEAWMEVGKVKVESEHFCFKIFVGKKREKS